VPRPRQRDKVFSPIYSVSFRLGFEHTAKTVWVGAKNADRIITLFVKLKFHCSLVAALGLAVAASANPLTFGGFTGTFPYVENGLAVTASQTPPGGAWNLTGANTLGAVAHLNAPNVAPGAPGTINVSGGPFHFLGVELAAGPAGGQIYAPLTFDYSITGSLNGVTVFSTTSMLASISSYGPAVWSLVAGNPSALIDSLAISLRTGSSGGVVATGYALRNLDVTPVPEVVSTAALLGVSIFALAMSFRRRQQE
jgi:hypothetical protein